MNWAARAAAGLFTIVATAGWANAQGEAPPSPQPWMNTTLSADARADLVQAQLTDDEALQLVKGYFGANVHLPYIKPAPVALRPILPGTAGFVPGIARLGIPSLIETDAGVGIANTLSMRPADQATAFPSGLMNAAMWNPPLAFAAGEAIGTEARDRGFNVVLDGGLNLARDPRGGRTFEYAGEDPLLAGATAGEEMAGIQSAHVISTTKHFAFNDLETGRGVVSATIDEEAARESDLLAFEIALEHGNPGAVMCAYNRFNAVYSCENDVLLNQVLKRDWGYSGWVLSDWGGVHSTVAAANAGLDQESASGFDHQEYFGAPLKKALADGTVSAARFHDMVHRILRSMIANGLFDFPPARQTPSTHIEAAERNAEEGIVLLKNDANILPLSRTAHRIAVIGAHSDYGVLSGGGSSQVVPLGDIPSEEHMVGGPVYILPNGAPVMPLSREIYDPPSPLAAIAKQVPRASVRFAEGSDIAQAASLARDSDIAIVFVKQWMTEGQDVPSLALPGAQDALIDAVVAANPRTIVVLETGGPVAMPWLPKVPAALEAWYSGSGGATAIAKILFGDADPSGRLPITFPQSEDQLPRPALPDRDKARQPFDIAYTEGADVGYRWFARQNLTPLFPFGFGLSYTQFHIDGLSAQGGDTITASVNVTNVGAREGIETVEFYATPPAPGGQKVSRLVGWTKIDLKPGETHTASVSADPRLLGHFDPVAGQWKIDAGSYTVRAASSATDAGLSVETAMSERSIKP